MQTVLFKIFIFASVYVMLRHLLEFDVLTETWEALYVERACYKELESSTIGFSQNS